MTNKSARDGLNSKQLWHLKLGYATKARISKLEKARLIGSLGEEHDLTCESYILGNMTKNPFDGHIERATLVLELVHSNVCGLFYEMSMGGFHYFITFTNDFFWYGYKHESFEKFKEFKTKVDKQTSKHVKTL